MLAKLLQSRRFVEGRLALTGRDDCQIVCPWNRFSQPSGRNEFEPRAGLVAPKLADIEAMDEVAFAETFRQSPLKRRGLAGVRDNADAIRAHRR